MAKKSIRPLKEFELVKVVDYFHSATDSQLVTMGVDKNKLTPRVEWEKSLKEDYNLKDDKKTLLYLGWEYDGALIGHSNLSHIYKKEYSKIHLHIWDSKSREKGLGSWYFKKSVNYFLEVFKMETIYCEPNADNSAPNKSLQKLGLIPVKKYRTTPGIICFEQYVNRYEITIPFKLT